MTTDKWFFFALMYLVVDYGRPQDILPIGFMRPGMIVILILVYFLVFNNGILLSKTKQSRMIWYFVILTAAYVPFARNNYWAFQTTKDMFLYLPFILSTIICVNSIERLKKMISVYIALMIYISIYSLFHSGMGSGNYFQDENDVSLFINMWLPFCFFLFLYENEKVKKIFYAAGVITGLIAIVVSFSRGGFVGLLSMVIVIWLVSPKKLISFVVICLLGSMIYIYSGTAYKREMSTVTDLDEGTAKARLESWKSGWDMFVDNPLGVGGGNFMVRFPEYQTEYFKRNMWGRAAHSIWIQLLTELGVIGALIFGSLLFYNLKDILWLKKFKENEDKDISFFFHLSLAFLASFAGYFSSGSFLSVLYYPHYYYLTAVIVVTRRLAEEKLKSMPIVVY